MWELESSSSSKGASSWVVVARAVTGLRGLASFSFFLLQAHAIWPGFATIKAEFVLETVVFFFRCKFSKGLRTLRNRGIDLCFICDKVAVSGRRRRAWSS